MNEYKKDRLTIHSWEVSRKDLLSIYSFFAKRFNRREIEIHLDTENGQSASYWKIEKLLHEMDRILKKGETVNSILFTAGHIWGSDIDKQKSLWIEIRFDINEADIYIYARDKDGSLAEWVKSTYVDLKKLQESIASANNDVSGLSLNFYKHGKPKEVNVLATSIFSLAFKKGDGWFKNPAQLFSIYLSVAGITVSVTSLILQILLK